MLNYNLDKMKTFKIKKYSLVLTAILTFSVITSCSDEFLDTEPLSFLTPENALNSADGMRAMLSRAHVNIRAEFYGDGLPLITENIFSEVAIEGTTDKSGPAQDLNLLIVPDANLNSSNTNRIGWYWEKWYENIKFANTVISRIDDAEYADDAEKNAILGVAYFHRAYAYYRLTQQFGDVPLLLREYTAPKLDFSSTARMTILTKMKADLDIAATTVPVVAAHGEVSRGAVNHLLTKVNLAMGEFDDAIASATAVISGGYDLMTDRFGADAGDASKDVIWDLHRPENKINSEGILMGISRTGVEGSATRTSAMRQAVPLWWRFINTPDGANGMSDAPGIEIDQVNQYGRGIGRNRGVIYSTKEVWTDPNDLRHKPGNWIDMEDIVYNAPSLKTAGNAFYGEKLVLHAPDGTVLCSDTIRNWYGWPNYKLFIPETDKNPAINKPSGGDSDWYIFRLAETYLLRAEAYIWKGDQTNAALDINVVRNRAGASDMPVADVNIGSLLDERVRELYYEEPRNTELTRMAFIFAMTGKQAYNGQTYSLSNFHEKNFWYDRIMEKTDFYNRGVKTIHGDEYTMSPYHALYPVPAGPINANTQGRINQNLGYPGAGNNIEPLSTIVED